MHEGDKLWGILRQDIRVEETPTPRLIYVTERRHMFSA
jgi:hypothetical protein